MTLEARLTDLAETIGDDVNVLMGARSARLRTTANQDITNTGSPWNTIGNLAAQFDFLGLSVAAAAWTVPFGGVYELASTLNIFDNNSARVAHRERYLVNGVQPADHGNFEGHNYLRDATNHDSAANVYLDHFVLATGDQISLQAQTNSSTVNTSTVLANSWVLIKYLGRA